MISAVHETEVRGKFFVASHDVSHPRTDIDARQRSPNQREEDGGSLHEHEGFTRGRAAKQPGTGNEHHVTPRRARRPGVGDRIAAVEHTPRSEILEELTDYALNNQGQQHR